MRFGFSVVMSLIGATHPLRAYLGVVSSKRIANTDLPPLKRDCPKTSLCKGVVSPEYDYVSLVSRISHNNTFKRLSNRTAGAEFFALHLTAFHRHSHGTVP